VPRIAIIAGALRLTERGVFAGLPTIDRVYCRLSRYVPWVARLCFRAMRFTAGRAPDLSGRLAAGDLGEADGAVLRGEGFPTFT